MNAVAEQMVFKSNSLIESAYRLTAMEQRIILACIAQVRRDEAVTDEIMYSITAEDISAMNGGQLKHIYQELKDAALKLKRREIWIKEDPNGGKSKPEILITGWVQSIRYKQNQGRVELRFSKDVLPYVSQLKSHFTGYKLKEIGGMDSAHAIRLFELLVQYKQFGQRDIAVDELRELLLLESKYPKIAELKRWVIDPAVKQINQHSSLRVEYTQRKSGRKITAFVFVFKEKALPKSRKTIEHTPPLADIKAGSIAAMAAKKPEKFEKVLRTQKEADNLAREGEIYAELWPRLKREGYVLKFKPVYNG